MNTKSIIAALVTSSCTLSPIAIASEDDSSSRGIVQTNDGSFNYQGTLEFGGVPANGDFYFRFSFYDSIIGGNEVSPLYSEIGPITATDGLFNCNIQMGDNTSDAMDFWSNYGDQVKYLNIEVGQVEGIYTTLSPRVFVGSTPHAQHSQFAQALTFPYVDTYSHLNGDPDTMMAFSNVFGGTTLDLQSEVINESPTLLVHTDDQHGFSFDNGLIMANGMDKQAGVVGIADQFSIIGIGASSSSGNHAAILGEVQFDANEGIIAIWALNSASGNDAALGTADYSGDFNRDVIIRRDLRVRGNPTRDYSFNEPSPVGPLAYGSISAAGNMTSGTGNMSVSWDAVNSVYNVSIANESVSFATHTVSISVVDTNEPRLATFNTVSGVIRVKIWDLNSGNIAVQDNFSIVIHDPTATVISRAPVPHGVDEDKYTERTGVQLIQTQPRNEPVKSFDEYGSGTSK